LDRQTRRLVEFPSEEGQVVVVEVEDMGIGGRRGLSPSNMVERAHTSFDEAMDRARPIATGIISKVRSLSDPPDEVEVEFGLSLSAEAGAVLAAASTEAHYKVTLTWRREQGA